MPTKPLRHTETQIVDGRRLGRRPNDPDRATLRLSRLLTGVVPDHPATVDHFGLIPPSRWGMLGNDRYGDCGPADVVHDRVLVAKYLAGQDIYPNPADALDLYKRSGNPNFPADDNGVVMADMLDAVHKQGVRVGSTLTRCVAYAQVDVTNLDEVHAAIAIFGSLSTGADLDRAQSAQTDAGKPWDYVGDSPEWGGHAFLVGRYNSDTGAGRPDLACISWGQVIGITDAFWAHQVQEAWVVIWPEHLANHAFLTGVDQKALASDYQNLTKQPLPVAPSTLTMTVAQAAANQAFAAKAHVWLQRNPATSQFALDLSAWLKAWGP